MKNEDRASEIYCSHQRPHCLPANHFHYSTAAAISPKKWRKHIFLPPSLFSSSLTLMAVGHWREKAREEKDMEKKSILERYQSISSHPPPLPFFCVWKMQLQRYIHTFLFFFLWEKRGELFFVPIFANICSSTHHWVTLGQCANIKSPQKSLESAPLFQ